MRPISFAEALLSMGYQFACAHMQRVEQEAAALRTAHLKPKPSAPMRFKALEGGLKEPAA